jgi:hypothetical protein
VAAYGAGCHALRIQGYAYDMEALAFGAPFSKLVCMGRAPMIPGFLGSNIEGVFKPEKRAELFGHWEELPPAVKEFGKYPEEIFAGWEPVQEIVGKEEIQRIPFGSIAMHAFADKLACGLQQFMAEARNEEALNILRG